MRLLLDCSWFRLFIDDLLVVTDGFDVGDGRAVDQELAILALVDFEVYLWHVLELFFFAIT